VADVLFGDVCPSGKLPLTFPKSLEQLPAFDDYSMIGRTYRYMTEQPLYPFGFGLSYSTFEYTGLKLEKDAIQKGDSLNIQFTITPCIIWN
jgi:beta-glucosidase